MFKVNSMEKFATEILKCEKTFRDIADVRFKPPCIVFEDPYEGKKFERILVMQNVGKQPVFVRINRPSSSAIHMATIPAGMTLAPGMTITRKIKYTSAMASLNATCIIPIFIDKTAVSYEIFIKISEVLLSTEPHLIDFGCINAGPTTSKRTIDLINSGVKASRFAVDLGQNDLNIVVTPMKGMIMGKSRATFRVEMNAMKEGHFQSEFWIISQVPLCIKVLVDVVMGKMEVVHEFPMKMFTFLQFPRTYYGVTNTKAVLVKNNSYNASMFYISADFDTKKLHLDVARKESIDYNFYDVIPSNGRLPPRDCRAFLFRFAPKKQYASKNEYILAMFSINKLYCDDIDLVRYEDKKLFEEKRRGVYSISSAISVAEREHNFTPMDDLDMDGPRPEPVNFFESSLRVLLHGESEVASVSIIPDELVLDKLIINQKEIRVLSLTNNSKNLPIFFKYTKTTFVEVKPKFARLNALESKEISVEITSKSYDNFSSRIHFNLLYFDEPRLNNHLKIVGEVAIPFSMSCQVVSKPLKPDYTLVKDVVFDKPLIMTNKLKGLVEENAYVALPDDLPRSLRPWKSDKIFKTLYAALPRYKDAINEFELSREEVEKRNKNKDYYRGFIRRQAEMIHRSLPHAKTEKNKDYEVSQDAYACHGFSGKLERRKKSQIEGNFIPLTPLQMSNISITPRNTIVDNVVPRSSFLERLTITNKNPFAVRIYLMPHKSDLFVFPLGRRKIIWPNSEEYITYECYTESTRIQNHTLDVIVNDCHVYETSISVNIVPKVLHFSFYDGKFLADEPPYKYLEISNKVNADISFNWDFIADLNVEPMNGIVEPGRSLTCLISYDVEKCNINNYEMVLKMDNRLNQTFRFMLDKLTYEISFTDEVNFGEVGVNMMVQKKAILSNFCIEPLSFAVEMEEIIPGLKVSPSFGKIDQKSTKVFTFFLCKDTCESFTCNMILNVANTTLLPVKITGNVVLPKVMFKPDIIRFKKMSASSFDVKHFKVKNISNFKIFIEFDNVNMPEMQFYLQNSKTIITNEQFFLEADEEISFTINYYPSYLLFTSFSAPILVNKIPIGDKRLKSGLKLNISVLTNKLCVDTWRYDFVYYPYFNFPCVQEHTIAIHNPSKSLVTFCIRFDNLKAPFSFKHVQGGICIMYECAIVCQLETEENVSFLATFEPNCPGTYEVSLPLFIKDDFSSDAHNIFLLTGVYPTPKFVCEEKKIHLGLIPLNFRILKVIKLELRYHRPDCIIKVFNEDLSINIDHENVTVNKPILMHDVKIIFHCLETHILNSVLEINCTCGGFKVIKCTGATENNFFTNCPCAVYFSHMLHKPIDRLFNIPDINTSESKSSLSSYYQISMFKNAKQHEYNADYFPSETNLYRKYMDKLVLILEQWIYEQGFFGLTYYTIPDTICTFETGEFVERLKKTCRLVKFIKLPLFMLLQNLCGPSINEIFKLEINENDSLMMQIYKLYAQLIHYYLEIEGCISHVEPEYLLPYDSYVEMQKENKNEEILPYTAFYKISKHYWIDVLSQTIKLFYYKRLIYHRLLENSMSYHTMNATPSQVVNGAVYSDMGNTLLCWIDKNWNEQKYLLGSQVFGNNCSNAIIEAKHINNFEEDLADGLGLCAVTIGCCPYLIKYLYGIYVPPTCKEEYFHNAAKLAQVWKMLNSSYTIMPKNIIEPNAFHMLLFVTYLYEFLMKLRPKDTLCLNTDLSSHCSENVAVVNENDDQIKYLITFFNNEMGTFSVDATTLVIPPHSIRKLKVSYFAKFIKKHKATMVLCGESPGGKFSHGKAFNIEGTPTFNSPQTEETIVTRLYHMKEVKLQFSSPYPVEASYQILCTETAPNEVDNLNIIPYSDIIHCNPIPIIKLKKNSCESDSTGAITQTLVICSICKQNRKFWIFAHNEDVGDFLITLKIITKVNKDMIKIPLQLPMGFKQLQCICKDKTMQTACPKFITVKIPAKNTHLWKVVMNKMIKNSDPNEKRFWKKYQKSPIGVNVIKRMLMEKKEYINPVTAHIFNTTVEYFVSVKTDHVHAKQNTLVIKDTTSVSETVELVLHIDKGEPKSIVINLESTDFKEIRIFKVLATYDIVEENDDTQL